MRAYRASDRGRPGSPHECQALLVRWAPQLRDEIAHVYPQGLGDLEDLDELEPPLPTFVLGDERLRPPELLG